MPKNDASLLETITDSLTTVILCLTFHDCIDHKMITLFWLRSLVVTALSVNLVQHSDLYKKNLKHSIVMERRQYLQEKLTY